MNCTRLGAGKGCGRTLKLQKRPAAALRFAGCYLKGALGLMALAGLAPAQSFLQNRQLLGPERNGFHVYDVRLSGGYSSSVGSFENLAAGAPGAGGSYSSWGVINTGYTHTISTARFGISYRPSYFRNFRFSDSQAFNHVLDMQIDKQLAPNWVFSIAGTAQDVTLQQYLFSLGGSTQPFRPEIQENGLTDSSTPALGSALQTTFYGQRVINFGGSVALTYRPSSRTQLIISGTVWDTQSRAVKGQTNLYQSLVPRSLMQQSGVSYYYNLTPRSYIGVQALNVKMNTPTGDYMLTSVTPTVGRRLGRRVVVSVLGGPTKFTPLGNYRNVLTSISYIAGATAGFYGRTNTFTLAYQRTLGDTFGAGAVSTTTYNGSWTWRNTARTWSWTANGGRLELPRTARGNLSTWQANGAITRGLGRQVSLSVEYGFLSRTQIIGPLNAGDQAVNAARLTLAWIPFLRDSPPLEDPNLPGQGGRIGGR